MRLRGLIALLHDDPRVQAFAESELDRLLVHEARTGGGLVELLRQHLAVGGNKTELARVSHRSRPAQLRMALSNSYGFGGNNTSMVLRRSDAA